MAGQSTAAHRAELMEQATREWLWTVVWHNGNITHHSASRVVSSVAGLMFISETPVPTVKAPDKVQMDTIAVLTPRLLAGVCLADDHETTLALLAAVSSEVTE